MEDVQYVIDNLEEVALKEPDEPNEALLTGQNASIYISWYNYQYERFR